jgi:flagellin-specific chaperone FliS
MSPGRFTRIAMQEQFPEQPFPSFGELMYHFAKNSTLVKSHGDDLYDALKQFQDERKRPRLAQLHYPVEIMVKVQRRLAKFIRSPEQARAIFQIIESFRQGYIGTIVRHDMTLLNREQTVGLLWLTIFPLWCAFLLTGLQRNYPGVDIRPLLLSKEPLAYHLTQLCPPESKMVTIICDYRADKHGIDRDNTRKTVHGWLSGKNKPSLENLHDFLDALGKNSTHDLMWAFVARLLAKTDAEHKKAILDWVGKMDDKETHNAYDLFGKYKNSLGMHIGKSLNIGMDRPYSKIVKALYEPKEPRNVDYVINLIERLEKTWEPIHYDTLSAVLRLRARLLVLMGRPQEGYERYVESYEQGMGRDPDAYKIALDEALAVAGLLNKPKEVKRFHELLQLYWQTEWDGRDSTLSEHFERMFPRELHFIN